MAVSMGLSQQQTGPTPNATAASPAVTNAATTNAAANERDQSSTALRSQLAAAPVKRALTGLAIVAAGAAWLALDGVMCPFAALTGWPCPGCGLTRAGLALVQGQFARAVHFHPLSPAVFPVLGVVALDACVSLVRGRPSNWAPRLLDRLTFSDKRLNPDWLWFGLCAVLVFVWAARFLGAFGGPVPVRSLWH